MSKGFTEEERKKMRFMMELFGLSRGNEMVDAMALVDFEFRKANGKNVDKKTAKDYIEAQERLRKELKRIIVPE